MQMGENDTSSDDTEHVITVTSVRKHRGAVDDPDRLVGKKKHVDLHGTEWRVGVALDVVDELRKSYECSCGERFLKPETAAEHLRNERSVETGTEGSK
jgi:hypothetical protein